MAMGREDDLQQPDNPARTDGATPLPILEAAG
jgi:hypothetical protein